MAENQTPHYNVFLSHNSRDKVAVELLAVMLKKAGLNPFLDKWNLIPGEPIEDGLIRALENSESAVIFVGPGGDGPWQSEEMRDILKRAVKSHNEFRAIPVLLPEASAASLEKSFLGSRLWIEFKSVDDADALLRLAKAIQGEASGDSLKLPDEPAPYRGLERYERIEKPEEDFFFGRDEEIRALVGRLVKERFVAVVGASGSGKSSLIRAGLTKQLAEDIQPGIRRWTTITVEPGSAPFRSLAIQIAVAAGIPVVDRERWLEQTVEKWSAAPDGVRQTIETLFAGAKEPLLVFIDQFEEIFTHRREGVESESMARNLVANLADLWRNGGDRVRVAVALRADFVVRCLEIGPLKELLQDRTMLVGEVGDDALREIVKEPAARVGAFLEKGLMERILKDVRSGSGSLPLLQQALHGLWRNRTGAWLTHDAYTASGGVARALNDQAQAAFTALDDGQKKIADSLFPRLITLGEGVADTRRRVKRSELYPRDVEPGAVNAVIDTLSGKDARILVTTRAGATAEDLGSGEDFVEFTHEALLSNWEHLVELLKTERTSIRRHRSLTTAAVEWESNPEGERQKFLLRAGQLVIAEQWAKDEGGYARMTDLEDRFLKASIAERDAEEERKAKNALRLKIISISATVAALIAIVVGCFAVGEKNKAIASEKKASEEREKTISETIKATWKAGALVRKSDDDISGLRSLYDKSKNIVGLDKLEKLSPVPVFAIGGPHQSEFNFESYQFGHYNPKFLEWAGKYLIPAATDAAFKRATQPIYDRLIRENARLYYTVYQDLQADPEFLKEVEAGYTGKIEEWKGKTFDATTADETPGNYIQNAFFGYAAVWTYKPLRSDWVTDSVTYYASTAPGFWIRREMDGTAKAFFQVLEKVLLAYDAEFMAAPVHAMKPKQRVAAFLTGHWSADEKSDGPDLEFDADGSFHRLDATHPAVGKWEMVSLHQIKVDGETVEIAYAAYDTQAGYNRPFLKYTPPPPAPSRNYVKNDPEAAAMTQTIKTFVEAWVAAGNSKADAPGGQAAYYTDPAQIGDETLSRAEIAATQSSFEERFPTRAFVYKDYFLESSGAGKSFIVLVHQQARFRNSDGVDRRMELYDRLSLRFIDGTLKIESRKPMDPRGIP